MGNNNRKQELIDTLQKDLSASELVSFYQSRHIIFERVDLFRDFVISLTKIISSTYLGDSITPPEKQFSHFKWCWKKNINNFEKENIYFNVKGSHYDYFMKYYMDTFYTHDDKDLQAKLIIEFWTHIMSYLPIKRSIDLGVFMVLYELLSKNLVLK
jgi:hypothetical protein